MGDSEVQQLAGRINSLPAGADISWGAVLLIILIGVAVWWFWQR